MTETPETIANTLIVACKHKSDFETYPLQVLTIRSLCNAVLGKAPPALAVPVLNHESSVADKEELAKAWDNGYQSGFADGTKVMPKPAKATQKNKNIAKKKKA